MRIGVASEWIGERVGGLERYAVELIRALVRLDRTNDYELFLTPRGGRLLESIANRRVRLRLTGSNSRWHYVPIGLPLAVGRHPVDVLHATFSVAPWCPARRTVLTVHDVAPDVHPRFFPAATRRRFRWLLRRGVARADRIIVPSHATREELLLHYPCDAGKVVVIPEGVAQTFGSSRPAPPPRDGAGSDFILYVGRFHQRKNLSRLVEAFGRLRARRRGLRLVLVGRDLWGRRALTEKIHALGLERDVIFPGYVSDAELDGYYARARVFAFPSLHEGFGIPPLEAMARGVPVVAANVSAMPEVLGDAALLVDPLDVDALANGLERVLEDEELRGRLMLRGRARTARYTWEAAGRATLEVYRGTAGRGAKVA